MLHVLLDHTKTSSCAKAIAHAPCPLTIPKVSSFTVDLSCRPVLCITKPSPAAPQYKRNKSVANSTNQYHYFALLKLRLFSTREVLCELQNWPEKPRGQCSDGQNHSSPPSRERLTGVVKWRSPVLSTTCTFGVTDKATVKSLLHEHTLLCRETDEGL